MLGRLGGVLGSEEGEIGAHLRVGGMALEKFPHPRPRIGKQNLLDELDGRRRALDVQQDGADVVQLDAVRSGMYVGPMQSGW